MKARILPVFLGLALALSACSVPSAETGDPAGKRAVMDSVDLALTEGDCATAVNSISTLYNSKYTDNEVRMKMASAYGCHAGINFFKLIGDISGKGSSMLASSGAGFWQTVAQMFPSEAGKDYIVQGAVLATDALQATLLPGIALLPSNTINATSFNPGSVYASDRLSDANIYSIFTTLVAIGGLESRYGKPDATNDYHKTKHLPWVKADSEGIDGDGCAYAASIINFIDALGATSEAVTGPLSTTLDSLNTTFSALVNTACALGCSGTVPGIGAPLNPRAQWQANGCGIATACSECPAALRDRTRCTRATDSQVSCAASGLINFINASDAGWLGNPADGNWEGP